MSKRNDPEVDLSALSGLAPELAEMLVSVACDIALVLDDGGVIQSIAFGGSEPVRTTAETWVGQRWADTVTGDTRRKAQEFLDDLTLSGVSRLRHVNHTSAGGADLPIAYTAVRLGQQGPTLAVGRDLRAVSAMQQRLVQTQQDMERDYWQRRQAETRYRLLFQVAAEPILIVDANTFEVLDSNRAAGVLFGVAADQLTGQSLEAGIDPKTWPTLRTLLETVRVSARVGEGTSRLAHGLGSIGVSVTPFQTDSAMVLLIRARSLGELTADEGSAESRADAVFAGLVKRTPDAVVISDAGGRLILANLAFRELIRAQAGEVIVGRSLSTWIGESERRLAEILATVRDEGSVRLFGTRLRRNAAHDAEVQHGQVIDIELSATLILDHDSVGFIIRASHHQESGANIGIGSPDRAVH